MHFEIKKISDWSFFRIPELEKSGITHGFCTNSSPSNLLHSETKQNFLDVFSLDNLVVMNQEHGDNVHVISNGEKPCSGDGLIILEKRVAGIIKTADCLPIILCDASYPIASIIHSGWRGTAKRIVMKSILAMERLGGIRDNMIALLGPSIGPCCYEVKDDIYTIFHDDGFPEHIFHRKNNSLFFDLRRANTWMLRSGGVNKIYNFDMCTYCNDGLFYSFRRGDTGKRQINFVSLEG
jgi:purine-nucleoside/S-methyl-5'-thioadenosine phosphorylase / adenosine deaminase